MCIRDSIERPEALDSGSIILTGINEKNILNSIELTKNLSKYSSEIPADYSISNTSDRVVKLIQGLSNLKNNWLGINKK